MNKHLRILRILSYVIVFLIGCALSFWPGYYFGKNNQNRISNSINTAECKSQPSYNIGDLKFFINRKDGVIELKSYEGFYYYGGTYGPNNSPCFEYTEIWKTEEVFTDMKKAHLRGIEIANNLFDISENNRRLKMVNELTSKFWEDF
uniref:Uncharacterized protein n=1 Tax=viral metagenome TaxID=1070528 RepID=A0A6H1ZYC6_9ZZZZ